MMKNTKPARAISVLSAVALATALNPASALADDSFAAADKGAANAVAANAESVAAQGAENVIDAPAVMINELPEAANVTAGTVKLAESVAADAALITVDGLNYVENADNPDTVSFVGWASAPKSQNLDIPEAIACDGRYLSVTNLCLGGGGSVILRASVTKR